MTEIKLDTETFRTIGIFEQITKIHAKDCIVTDDCVYFLIDPEKIGLAIGKGGTVVKEVSRVLSKPIRIYEYSNDPKKLIKNMISSAENIEIDNDEIKLNIPSKERSSVIGKSGKNINIIKEFLLRHCGIKSLRIK